jgi:hypothetical protein
MNEKMNKRMQIGLVIAVLIAIALLAWFWALTHLPGPPPHLTESKPTPSRPVPGDMELFYTLDTVFSTLDATLLVALLALYLNTYVRRKVQFTLWLAIFCTVLLLDALTSNPIIQWAFGFSASGLGPFAMLPDVFTFVALVILLYLTLKY